MDESKLLGWMTRLWCLFILPSILSNRILNMDEKSTCGQKVEVFETPVIINARSSIPPVNPPQICQVLLETTSRDEAYRLQITIKSVAIKDSSFMLRIYDGQGAVELLRQIGASSKSTDIIYTKSSFATIILTRSREVRYSENDFTLEVKGYRDPDEAEPVIGGSKLKPIAIVGIVLGIILLIGFAAVLCFMYNTGILTKKHGSVSSSHPTAGSKESLKASSISSISSRKGYTGREDTALSSAFLSSVTAKFSNNGNVSKSGSGRNTKLPPSRAEVRTISDKDEYEEPISTRRNGKTSSVTFDTRQQQPQFFQRSYTGAGGGSQNGQRSPKSSMAKSKYGVPDRSSGHSNASYAEIKDYPYLSSNSKESSVPSKKSSQSPRSSLHSSSRDTGNGLISEGSSQASILKESAQKKTHAELLKEINSFDSRKLSNSDAADKEKSRGGDKESMYTAVKKKTPADTENLRQSDVFQDENTNFKSVPEAVITKSSNPSQNTQNGQVPSGSENSEQEKIKKNQNSLDEDEDENDREVRNIHANTTSLNDEEFSSNDSFMSKPDEPALMTNPLVNNAYIRNSIDNPSVQQNNAKNTNPPQKKHHGRKIPKSHSEDNGNYPESNGISSDHPHYGIPELVEKTPQNSINDYGFPSAFNAILSRTVKPDPNKTIEYGYHTQTNESNDESGKAAWYIESAPTKSGPIKTSAFFLQTSQPNQKNESVYANDPSMNGHGNQFGPEHTSTPVSTFQPGGPVSKPKAKPRNRSSTNSENPKNRFPLSIPQPEKGLSKGKSGQKSAVVKSGYDPNTGCQTTQVLWTDSIPDPTDPDPEMDNPCITRKTVNRITTRSTYGNLPENPFPLLNQIQMESNEPSFLSPSVVSRSNMLPSSEWASEIPRPEEISFYTQPSRNQSQAPIIHDGSQKHHNIKDRMTIA